MIRYILTALFIALGLFCLMYAAGKPHDEAYYFFTAIGVFCFVYVVYYWLSNMKDEESQ